MFDPYRDVKTEVEWTDEDSRIHRGQRNTCKLCGTLLGMSCWSCGMVHGVFRTEPHECELAPEVDPCEIVEVTREMR